MKIGIMFHSLIVYGGSQKVALNIAKHLARTGNDVELYCHLYNPRLFDPLLTGERRLSVFYNYTNRHLPKDSTKITSRFPLLHDFFFEKGKFSSLVSSGIDVLFGMEALAHAAMLHAKPRIKCPVTWYVFDPPQYALKARIGTLYNESFIYRFGLNMFALVEKKIVRKLDKVYVPSWIAKRPVDEAFGINSEIVRIGGVDVERISNVRPDGNGTRRRLGVGSEAIIVLSLGMFFPHRRYEDAVQAVVMLRRLGYKVYYIVAGSGETHPTYFQKINKLIRELKASDYIILLNKWMDEGEVLQLYYDCDIFVSPNDAQTWALAPLEAMAAGKPVIVTKGSGVSEVLEHGKTAVIVPPRQPVILSHWLRKLIENVELRKEIAENGMETVKTHWSYAKCANRLMKVLSSLVR